MQQGQNNQVTVQQALQIAISHFRSAHFPEAENVCRQVLQVAPDNVDFLQLLGLITSHTGREDEAVGLFERAVKLRENDPLLRFTFALTLQKCGQLDDALRRYKEALTLKPDYAEALVNIGNILKEQDKFGEAMQAYQQAIAVRPDSAEAYNNLGTALEHQEKPKEAEAAFKKAIDLKPDHAAAHYNLGALLEKRGETEKAAKYYAKAISFKSPLAMANLNLANVFRENDMLGEAIALYEYSHKNHPDDHKILAELVRLVYNASMWEKSAGYEARLIEMVREKRSGIYIYSLLCCSDATAKDLLTCAKFQSPDEDPPPFSHDKRKSGEKIKLGYLSSDFFEHATAYLMAELFERHDRSRFSVTAYSYSDNTDESPMRQRLKKAFDSFVDVSDLSDREAAQKIYDDGIDILVDIQGGLTKNARRGIAAFRPAPVQVSYLGYPGTTGARFIDYVIADRFVIPEDQEKFYSEKVVCLPDCYQPNETKRKIAEDTPTRAACGLPAKGFVFCCLNDNYKITARFFDVWMRLLQKVPDSVLWLPEYNKSVKEVLRQQAKHRAVDPDRLVFAKRIPLAEHLARIKLADLFLDTLPVNAHTTASDALWAGLPVLTCVGETFAGRVGGSLLTAANLPELITTSLADYEAKALHLAQHPEELAAIREKMDETKMHMPLFDIDRFVGNIESAYATMWKKYQAGEAAHGFVVEQGKT